MYRFKLKEIEVGDTEIRKGVKSTVTDIDPETGAISWDVVDAADFSSVYKALSKAKDFLDTLEKEGKAKDDTVIDGFAEDIAKLFNAFRTHVRKNYPKEYERVSRLKESINEQSEQWTQLDVNNINKSLKLALKTFNNLVRNLERLEGELGKHSNKPQGNLLQGMAPDSFDYMGVQNKLNKLYKTFSIAFPIDESEVEEGEGIGYLTPNAFGKNKKDVYTSQYGYKLVPKKIKGAGTIVKQLFEYSNFQQKRINVFGEIEDRINNILPMLSNAKNETAEFYNENPGSYAIVVPTDYILEILDEVELKLKQVQDK